MSGAKVVHAQACTEKVSETLRVSLGIAVPKKGCVCYGISPHQERAEQSPRG